MGLRESRIINSVHPWLGVRLQWMQDVAGIVGGRQLLISGVRTEQEQARLYDTQTIRPAAFPGCSQHEFGFAADAVWQPINQITSKGRIKTFTNLETDTFMGNAARHVGLHLVANDTGHVQMYPNSEFKAWAVGRGFCNPNPPPPDRGISFPLIGGTIDQFCGPGFTSLQIRPTGFICGPPSEITSLIGE